MALAISTTGFSDCCSSYKHQSIQSKLEVQGGHVKQLFPVSWKKFKEKISHFIPGTNLVVGLPVQSLGIMPASTIIRYRFDLHFH